MDTKDAFEQKTEPRKFLPKEIMALFDDLEHLGQSSDLKKCFKEAWNSAKGPEGYAREPSLAAGFLDTLGRCPAYVRDLPAMFGGPLAGKEAIARWMSVAESALRKNEEWVIGKRRVMCSWDQINTLAAYGKLLDGATVFRPLTSQENKDKRVQGDLLYHFVTLQSLPPVQVPW